MSFRISSSNSIERAEAALLADTERVEMVLRRLDRRRWRAAAHDGWCEIGLVDGAAVVVDHDGRNPLARTMVDHLVGFDVERANVLPRSVDNAYPYAPEQILQFFDHPSAPDLLVMRTAAFHVHGNLGEHGNLGAVQTRAAFAAGGCGIRTEGIVDRHLRAIDVAPTIAALLGCHTDAAGRHLRGQDGTVDRTLLDADGDGARHVVAFLFDGTNANLFVDALERGQLPTIAGIVGNGVCYRQGLVASLPSVTLPNHVTLLTGAHPGHHGILSNSWHDRTRGATPNLLEPDQMIRSCDHLSADVETLHEAIHRSDPGAFCATTYEYADRGADWSTYDLLRAGRRPAGVPRRNETVPHASSEWFDPDSGYHFMSRIDTASVHQACALIDGDDHPVPTFLWVNLNLTDDAGHHGGPHSDEARSALIDTDARIASVLESLERAGVADDTAFFVMADHGMEQTDPDVTGHYRDRLDGAGVGFHDVDDGLLYLS
jgi:phosphonoacetate hydrolase